MGVAADMAGGGEGASTDAGPEGHLMRLRGTSMPARHRGQHRPVPMETGCSSGGRNVWLGPGAMGRELKRWNKGPEAGWQLRVQEFGVSPTGKERL